MQLIRFAVSTAVETTGRVLSFAGSTISTVSRLIQSQRPGAATGPGPSTETKPSVPGITRPDGDGSPPAADTVLERVEGSDVADRRGRVIELPPTPLLDAEPHVRRSETHIAELAGNTAGDVIAEIDNLSTDELRQLVEYETAHRNRKTVLAAVEKALAPTAGLR